MGERGHEQCNTPVEWSASIKKKENCPREPLTAYHLQKGANRIEFNLQMLDPFSKRERGLFAIPLPR